MKVSLNWLKNYINLDDIRVDEIADLLTMAGLEVEAIDNQKEKFKNFVVGNVISKNKHHNADKLSVCRVNDGENTFQVICGAPNVEVGQKVVFAREGAVIPKDGMEIKKIKLRGVDSFGMICSEDELTISNDHSGIIVLDEKFEPGTPISEVLKLNDVVFEIGITPNRSDALSHLGVARDLSALLNRELIKPKINLTNEQGNIDEEAVVEIQDSFNCPRYSAKVIKNVKVDNSPEWLQERIKSIGLRPINNVVDITNFVLHELGQPLHAFDLDKLSGKKIIVKTAYNNDKFVTLDSIERELNDEVLMICDEEKYVAIGGVMGGENSEVTSDTKNILIESAFFRPGSIRKTSKFLGLSSDSSYRFERGCNYDNTIYAAERAAQLITEICGGTLIKGTIDIYPNKINRKKIELRFARVKEILGYEIPKEKQIEILKNLEIEISEIDDDKVTVIPPGFRPDIEREIDLIEELARINGYNNIPAIERIRVSLEKKHDDAELKDKLRDTLVGMGLSEVYENTLVPENLTIAESNPVKVLNPQSLDMAFLRNSLLPGLLSTIKLNISVGEKNLALFEIGTVFQSLSKDVNDFSDIEETEKVAIIITGLANVKEWYQKARNVDFFDLKGIVSTFLKKNTLDSHFYDLYYHNENKIFEFGYEKFYKEKLIGVGGKVKKDVLKAFDIDQDIFYFELNLGELKKIPIEVNKFKELLKYPKVYRDVALVIDKKIDSGEITTFIKQNLGKIIKDVHLFDVFEHESLGANKKSIGYSFLIYDETKTLTDKEADDELQILIEKLKKKFNAVLRGK